MPSTYVIDNAPTAITSTIAGLAAAISSARSGAVITVTPTGAATTLTLDFVQKVDYGVIVNLPPDQVYRVIGNYTKGMTVQGGNCAADTVLGSYNLTNFDAEFDNFERIAFMGVRLGAGFAGLKMNNGTDLILRDSVIEDTRGDGSTLGDVTRTALLDNIYGRAPDSQPICYFGTGASPVYGLSSAECTALGGVRIDATHTDINQSTGAVIDTTITGNYADRDMQGINNFSGSSVLRLLVANNDFRKMQGNAINYFGEHITIRNNLSSSSALPNITPAKMSFALTGAGMAWVGQNTCDAGFVNHPGYDLGSATLNGDVGTVLPTLPIFPRPYWAPAWTRPAASSYAVVPFYINGGGIRRTVAPAVGVNLTADIGMWFSYATSTRQYRWLRGATLLSTADVYLTVAADAATTITLEGQLTHPVYGASGYVVLDTVAIP